MPNDDFLLMLLDEVLHKESVPSSKAHFGSVISGGGLVIIFVSDEYG